MHLIGFIIRVLLLTVQGILCSIVAVNLLDSYTVQGQLCGIIGAYCKFEAMPFTLCCIVHRVGVLTE